MREIDDLDEAILMRAMGMSRQEVDRIFSRKRHWQYILSPIFEGMRLYYKNEQKYDIMWAKYLHNNSTFITKNMATAWVKHKTISEADLIDWDKLYKNKWRIK